MPIARMPDFTEKAAAMSVVGGAAGFAWLVREPGPNKDKADAWLALRRADQQRLEDAEAKLAAQLSTADDPAGGSAEGDAVVPVNGGRLEVKLADRLMIDRYSSVPPREPREVRRCLWQRQPASWEPFEEAHSALAEDAYGRLLQRASECAGARPPPGAEVAETVALPGGERLLRLVLTAGLKENAGKWVLTAKEEATSSWLSFASRINVTRGYAKAVQIGGEAEEELLSQDVGRLFVLVHGIGEKMWREDGTGMSSKVTEFRRNLHQHQLRAAGFVCNSTTRSWEFSKSPDSDEKPNLPSKYEVLEASWWQSVHNEELDGRLQRITLPSIPTVRQFANGAIADALFYSQAGQREQIVKTAAETIEAVISQFRRHQPKFAGEIVLVGHSLGGTILFELLRHGFALAGTKLSFVPLALFTLGSPTGIFMHCANDIPSADYTLPGGTRFFNIFHPLDPVAYRMEPLFFAELQNVVPETVPAEASWGGVNLHNRAKNWMRWATGELQEMEQRVQSVKMQLNGGDRVDWVLQDNMQLLGSAGEMMQAGSAHACYVPSPDVASFIYARTEALQGSVSSTAAPTFDPPPRSIDDKEGTEEPGNIDEQEDAGEAKEAAETKTDAEALAKHTAEAQATAEVEATVEAKANHANIEEATESFVSKADSEDAVATGAPSPEGADVPPAVTDTAAPDSPKDTAIQEARKSRAAVC